MVVVLVVVVVIVSQDSTFEQSDNFLNFLTGFKQALAIRLPVLNFVCVVLMEAVFDFD